jgi:hypothetical protein
MMLTGLALAMALGTDPTVALGTGPKMCAALTAADFTAVGLNPDPTPPRPPNSDDRTGAYCTYTKAFPIAGGLEFDIFDGESDPGGIVKTILGEGGGKPTRLDLAGVDESLLTLSPGDTGVTMASLVVRHRRLVFAITIPQSPKAKEQLLSLAKVVLSRVKH